MVKILCLGKDIIYFGQKYSRIKFMLKKMRLYISLLIYIVSACNFIVGIMALFSGEYLNCLISLAVSFVTFLLAKDSTP